MEKQNETTETQAPAKIEMPEQNGVRQPKPGTSCANIWDAANAASKEIGQAVAVGDLIDKLVPMGYKEATIKTQYARWRKFHGVEGRIESSAAKAKREEREAAKTAKAEEKVAKAKAREEEKARKAEEKAKVKAEKEAERERKAAEKAEAKAKKEAEKEAAKAEKDAE